MKTIRHIQRKPMRRRGQVVESDPKETHWHADVVKGESIRIHGFYQRGVKEYPVTGATLIERLFLTAVAEGGAAWMTLADAMTLAGREHADFIVRTCFDLANPSERDLQQEPWASRTGYESKVDTMRRHVQTTKPKFVRFDRTFRMGDTVEYDSYNLVYTGTIVGIGEKTVTVLEPYGEQSKKHRLDLHTFIVRNWDLDLDKIAERNHDTLMHV